MKNHLLREEKEIASTNLLPEKLISSFIFFYLAITCE